TTDIGMIATESRCARLRDEGALGGGQDGRSDTVTIRELLHHRPQNKLGCMAWSLPRAGPAPECPLTPLLPARPPGAPPVTCPGPSPRKPWVLPCPAPPSASGAAEGSRRRDQRPVSVTSRCSGKPCRRRSFSARCDSQRRYSVLA